MQKTWKRKRRNIFYTILTDVLFNLLAFYMLTNGGLQEQVGQLTNENRGFEIQIGNLNIENGGLKQTISNQGKLIGSLQDEIDKYARFRSGKAVTAILLLDVSGSMGGPIEQLGIGMEAICEIMPNRSKDFRVGILAFRKGVIARYPITQILPAYEDNGNSQQAVLSFIQALKPDDGWTEHESVFQEAVKAVSNAHEKPDPDREVIVVLMGDVGPSELDGKLGYTRSERDTKQRILSSMKKWASRGNNSVKTLYAESNHTRDDPSRAESKQWFEDLGAVSPKSASYSDTTSLLQAIYHAAGK